MVTVCCSVEAHQQKGNNLREPLTNDQLSDITKIAESKLEARETLVIDPELVLRLQEDLFWSRLQERENEMYLQECQDVITELMELADWEADEWDAAERLGKIRERLGMK